MNILFLDCDGVLNTIYTQYQIGRWRGLEPELVERARRMIARIPDCKVVLCSTWRMDPILKAAVEAEIPLYGVTPSLNVDWRTTARRGEEVREWMQSNPLATAYAVVDDAYEAFSPGMAVFSPDSDVGLTEAMADLVVAHFARIT